jgi:glycosyltransferase involved in cell wall biosynthesis
MVAYTNYRTDPRVIREAEAAVSGGYEVDFIALRRAGEPSEEMIGGVRVIHINQERYRGSGLFRYVLAYLSFFIRCFAKIVVLHLARRYRIVHVNNMPDFFVFAALVPKLMGARIILDIHDPMPNTFASKFKSGENSLPFKLLLLQERASAWFVDRVVTVHDPLKEHVLVKQHGLPSESIQVVANFADDELFKLQDRFQVPGLRLAFHGSILERYGLRDAMLALSRTRHRDRVSLKIIGEGDFSEQLKELIASLGLRGVVHFDNRMYPVAEIPRIIEDCNVGFVPLEISSITTYALPLKLLEYLSLGIPSITVRNVAIAHYFGDDDCFFYEPNDPESLPRVLDRLAENPELVRRYRKRAASLREQFTWSRERQKYVALLDELNGIAV